MEHEKEIRQLADRIIRDSKVRKNLLDIVSGTNYRWHNFIKDLYKLSTQKIKPEKSNDSFENWKLEITNLEKDLYEVNHRDNFIEIFKRIGDELLIRNIQEKEILGIVDIFEKERRLTLFPLEWDDEKLKKYLNDAIDLIKSGIKKEKVLGCVDEALSESIVTCFDAGSGVTRLIDAFKDEINLENYFEAVVANAQYIIENNITSITTHENCGASALIFNNHIKPLIKKEDFYSHFMNPDEIAKRFVSDTVAKIKEKNPDYNISIDYIKANEMTRPTSEHIAAGITIARGEIIKSMYEANPKYPYTFNVDTDFPEEFISLNINICLSIAFGEHGRLEEYKLQPFLINIIGNDESQKDELLKLVNGIVANYKDKPIKILKATN